MADEQKSLRDLMDDAGAQHGIAQRKLWRWVLTAMANELLPIFPEGMTLKTKFDHGGMLLTWSVVIDSALAAIERHIPSNDNWTKTLKIDPAIFDKWLKGFLQTVKIPRHAKRGAGAKAALREAVASFIAEQYPSRIPAGITRKIIARDFEAQHKTSVSERTVGRAMGRR